MGMPLSANDSKRIILFLLGGALAAVITACALAQFFPEPPPTETVSLGTSGWTRLILVAVAAILVGQALRQSVAWHGGWPDWPKSCPAMLICLLGAGVLLAGEQALKGRAGDEINRYRIDDGPGIVLQWRHPGQLDSMGLLCRGGAVCALAGAFLLLLPESGRRVALVCGAAFHFCGILSAVFSVPPPGGNAPWLVQQAWVRVYRPYLQFVYLNNAYHFYSPEPGPPSFMWYRLD